MPVSLLKDVNRDTVGTPWSSDGSCKSLIVDAVSTGGGTITFEVSRAADDSKPWTIPILPDDTLAIFTRPTFQKFDFAGSGIFVRARLDGATGASNVNVFMS